MDKLLLITVALVAAIKTEMHRDKTDTIHTDFDGTQSATPQEETMH